MGKSSKQSTQRSLGVTVPAVPAGGSTFETGIVIRPRLPIFNGIFHLGPDVLIASHTPHKHIVEHLHDHLYHMHIRYGFEIPRQDLGWVGSGGVALQVSMLIAVSQRVDCNPIFAAKGPGAEGVCLKIGDQDVHWVHDSSVADRATTAFLATGRKVPDGFRFIGFSTSDMEERRKHRYSAIELTEAVRAGLRVDQHFQATWIEPKDEPLLPYPVTIFLGDDAGDYHTFFELRPTVVLGAS
jgi:hypothetical protein